MKDVSVPTNRFERFAGVIDAGRFTDYVAKAEDLRRRFAGRIVWNINTTAAGGGVAEMLRSLLPYVRGEGVDSRWVVMEADEEFFHVTKRLHHALHGSAGDGSELGAEARRIYDEAMRANAGDLLSRVRPRDVVVLHDPQPAGLAGPLIRAGALVVWRCHIGNDEPNADVERGWAFLKPYLEEVPAMVFSRHAYVPSELDGERATIVTPSVDPFSPKNQELDERTVRSILVHVGIVEGPNGSSRTFSRQDGSPGRVDRQADVVRLGRPPAFDTPLVVQVSRWDPLKDPIGVMRGFTDLVEEGRAGEAHLVLAGPNVHAVADDPEGAAVLDDVTDHWRQLPHAVRHRVHLVCLPMTDVDENGAIVNALQRHATVVVQKSLREGFGLTVTEAMWKGRAVLASAVGGIRDQIDDGVHGVLLEDPADVGQFASALERLLNDPALRDELGRNARRRVRDEFLAIHQLIRHGRLLECLDEVYEECGRPAELTIDAMRRKCCHLFL